MTILIIVGIIVLLACIDYVMMVDALTMQPIEKADRDVLVAMAVYIGKTRLIDNFSYGV